MRERLRGLRNWLVAAGLAVIAGTSAQGLWGPVAGGFAGVVVAWLLLRQEKADPASASDPPPQDPPEPEGAWVPRPVAPVLTAAAAKALPTEGGPEIE